MCNRRCSRAARYRPLPDEIQPPVDHRPSRTDDPHVKDATVRRFYYETHESLRGHLAALLDAYNFAKRLKSLRGLTPFERICQLWTEHPEKFRLNPIHDIAGLNI